MCVYVNVCNVHIGTWGGHYRVLVPMGLKLTGHCEKPDVVVGNQIQVLWGAARLLTSEHVRIPKFCHSTI